MTTRLRRSIATLLAALIYVQTIYAGPYPVPASAPLIRLASPVPAAAASPAPVARRASRLVARALTGAAGYAGGVEPVEPAQAPGPVVVFGPNQYVRTTGS